MYIVQLTLFFVLAKGGTQVGSQTYNPLLKYFWTVVCVYVTITLRDQGTHTSNGGKNIQISCRLVVATKRVGIKISAEGQYQTYSTRH